MWTFFGLESHLTITAGGVFEVPNCPMFLSTKFLPFLRSRDLKINDQKAIQTIAFFWPFRDRSFAMEPGQPYERDEALLEELGIRTGQKAGSMDRFYFFGVMLLVAKRQLR